MKFKHLLVFFSLVLIGKFLFANDKNENRLLGCWQSYEISDLNSIQPEKKKFDSIRIHFHEDGLLIIEVLYVANADVKYNPDITNGSYKILKNGLIEMYGSSVEGAVIEINKVLVLSEQYLELKPVKINDFESDEFFTEKYVRCH